MNRQPSMYLASDLTKWETSRKVKGKWVPARPEGDNAFRWTWRFQLAWDVLTGKCDVIQWDEDF